jgi:hypothetical protein
VLATITACSGYGVIYKLYHIQFTQDDLYNPHIFIFSNMQLLIPIALAIAVAFLPKYLVGDSIGSNAESTHSSDDSNVAASHSRKYLSIKKRRLPVEKTGKNDTKERDGEQLNQKNPLESQYANGLSIAISGEGREKSSGPILFNAGSGNNNNASTSNDKQANNSAASSNETKVSEAINSKIESIDEEISKTKTEFAGLKEEMSGLKTEIQNISSAFESSLVELKAFQAEMVNPMNFIRQYFDTLEIKQLSDPVKTLHPPPAAVDPAPALPQRLPPPIEKDSIHQYRVESNDNNNNAAPQMRASAKEVIKSADEEVEREEYAKSRSMKRDHSSKAKNDDGNEIHSLLNAEISPSKMMDIVEIVDEVLAAMGPDGVDMLVEQYKLLGLKKEDELVIYNVMKMLNESNMMTDDVIAMFYRFGQVLGINDKEADLHYLRLLANKKRGPSSMTETRRQ